MPRILKRTTETLSTELTQAEFNLKARELAEARGAYAEIDIGFIGSRFEWSSVLRERPATIVIEGYPTTQRQVELLKLLLTSETLHVRGKNSEERFEIPTPYVVITTHDEVAAHVLFDGARHFDLFTMPVEV